jgi:molybdopterin-guanine dinucleotide biosynthesis protein A
MSFAGGFFVGGGLAAISEGKDAGDGISRFFKSEHGLEPLAGLYDPYLLSELKLALTEERLSLSQLARQAHQEGKAEVIDVIDIEQAFFRNFNTLADWDHEKGMSCDMP